MNLDFGTGGIAGGSPASAVAPSLWHTGRMARGWESKSVESQIESAESRRAEAAAVRLSNEEIGRRRERESLQLSRTRVQRDLASVTNPRYRESLEAALRHLDEKIAGLQ